MQLTRFVRIQLTIFAVLTVISLTLMGLRFMQLPALAGIGRYEVTMLTRTGGNLYTTANVTYRGQPVGKITAITPTAEGVAITLSMVSDIDIPADVDANVHSRSAIGEQYVDLVPRTQDGPNLRDESVIPVDRTSVPQDIGELLDTVDGGLEALPNESVRRLIDEGYLAFNGTGPDIGRLLDSANNLSGDAAENTAAITGLITDAEPVLDGVLASDPSIRAWAANVAGLSGQLTNEDDALRSLLVEGREAAVTATDLFQRLRPTLPLLLGNMVNLGQVAVTYNASLEQLLVLLPSGASILDTMTFPDRNGVPANYMAFKLGVNIPPPCTVGFLPPEQRRSAADESRPERPAEALYCALPQSDPNAVRGARNYPCIEHPGRRAPTVELCDSAEGYVPAGTNPWIGDPQPYVENPEYRPSAATVSPPAGAAPPTLGTATYDANGVYAGPDGRSYRRPDLAADHDAPGKEPTWQTLVNPKP